MIPFIRSLSELMAITESRETQKELLNADNIGNTSVDFEIEKNRTRSFSRKIVELPNVPKVIRRKWIQNKESVSRFFDDLDYNNQIQSSYDLTLIERQNKRNQRDVA